MSRFLSHQTMESFCGNVVPLWLDGQEDLSQAEIQWSCDRPDLVQLRSFAPTKKEESISNGVLLTLLQPGTAQVTADYEGDQYTCTVTVRAMRHAANGDPLQFFVGDFHNHTSSIHGHDAFVLRETGFPIDMIHRLQEDERMDFAVLSDHASTLNSRDFFRGFAEEFTKSTPEGVLFPGSEAEVTVIENDRFGIPFKNAGEIVCVNTDHFASTHSWEAFYQAMENSPYAVCVLAHPYIAGHVHRGIWNFSLHKNNTPLFKQLLKGVEMGNGGLRHANPINEYVYSLALDNGFHVSVTCSSDCHNPAKWGYDILPGKTVILAYEKSKEAFLEALLARRFYATESGNVKLRYSVNGYDEGSTLPLCTDYTFHVRAAQFHEDPASLPVKCRVISDCGKTVAEFENEDFSDFTFTLHSETARYFYLRFTDAEGRRTWSAPVWTSRPCDAPDSTPLAPLDASSFSVLEEESGKDASVLVCGDPFQVWTSELSSASFLIDMKEEKEVCALGHYTPYVIRKDLIAQGLDMPTEVAHFISRYEISASCDGVHFTPCTEGQIRVFSGEEILRFPKQKARYLRFRAINTTGAEWRTEFADYYLKLAELTVFEEKEC